MQSRFLRPRTMFVDVATLNLALLGKTLIYQLFLQSLLKSVANPSI